MDFLREVVPMTMPLSMALKLRDEKSNPAQPDGVDENKEEVAMEEDTEMQAEEEADIQDGNAPDISELSNAKTAPQEPSFAEASGGPVSDPLEAR